MFKSALSIMSLNAWIADQCYNPLKLLKKKICSYIDLLLSTTELNILSLFLKKILQMWNHENVCKRRKMSQNNKNYMNGN